MGKSSSRAKRLHRISPLAVRPGVVSLWARLRREQNWFRVGLVALVGALLVVVVHGRGPAFPFRLRQKPERDIVVKVKFSQARKADTDRLRREKARDTPPVLVNNPDPVLEMRGELTGLIHTVGKTPEYSKLPEPVRREWALSESAFAALRGACAQPEPRAALQTQVHRALTELAERGVLDRQSLGLGQGHRPPKRVQVLSAQTGAMERELPLSAVDSLALGNFEAPQNPLAISLSDLPEDVRHTVFDLIVRRMEPTLTVHQELTERARQLAQAGVSEVMRDYLPGELLVRQGQPIDPARMQLLKLEHETYLRRLRPGQIVERIGAIAVMVIMMLSLVGAYAVRSEPALVREIPRLLTLGILAVMTVALCRLLCTEPWHAYLLPLMLAAMMIALAYTPLFALLVNTCLGLSAAIAMGGTLSYLTVALAATASATLFMGRIRNRLTLVKIGTAVGVVAGLATWAAGILEQGTFRLVVEDTFWALGCGVIAGLFVSGALPLIERLFGIVTDISLLELSDVSHPLLQQLVQRAPGTYSHSNAIASLAEAAAESIGANALLCRVGSYYHDIGKIVKPQYFVENQPDAHSRHESLAPAMSKLIIIGHVKDGVDLARQHGAPEPIIRCIEEHHGTTLVEYFYHEATRRAGKDTVEEASFRYPGPKPASKETAILMLVDGVESASRTLTEPNPGSIESLVEKIVSKRLNQGQLDDSGLTLTEVRTIQQSLVKSLIGVYHGRVKYPSEQRA